MEPTIKSDKPYYEISRENLENLGDGSLVSQKVCNGLIEHIKQKHNLTDGTVFVYSAAREKEEPLLSENEIFLKPKGADRYISYPRNYPDIGFFSDQLLEWFWLPTRSEIDMGNDLKDFREICMVEPNIKPLLLHTIGYFACVDGIIIENVGANFFEEIFIPEFKEFFAVQLANEAVHAQVYGKLALTYADSLEEKILLFRSIEKMPAVKAKADWALYWMNKDRPIEERMLASGLIEAIQLTPLFNVIFWLESRYPGKLQGLVGSNRMISRDENFHVEFMMVALNKLPVPIPLKRAREMFESALAIELVFLRNIYPEGGIHGLDFESLEEHTMYIANVWFAMFQLTNSNPELLVLMPDGSIPSPRPEFRQISKYFKISFFETRNTNYKQPSLEQRLDLARSF